MNNTSILLNLIAIIHTRACRGEYSELATPKNTLAYIEYFFE